MVYRVVTISWLDSRNESTALDNHAILSPSEAIINDTLFYRITIHFSTCLFTNNESMIIKDGRFISVIQSGNITISMIPVQPTISVDISSNTTSIDFTEKLSLVPDHIDWLFHLNHSLIIQMICEQVIQ